MKRISILLLTSLSLAACSSGDKKSKDAAELAKLKKDRSEIDTKIRALEGTQKDSVKRTPVTVLEVQPGHFNSYIEVQSSITGDEVVNATPQMMGTIRSISVHPGQHVSQGAVMATLDDAAVSQQIAALDANVNLAKTVYERQQKLWAQQIGTEVQLLKARADYESASKNRGALSAQRNMYRIIAPISGTVDEVNVKVGDAAAPGGMGIRISSTGKLKAQANLGEAYLGKVKAGDPVTLLLPDQNDSIKTTLAFVAQDVNPISRTFNAEVRLGSNPKLHPNMSARMKIANYQNSGVITVPISAVQKTATGELVYVADGAVAKSVPIQTGRSSNGQVEILSGLKQGDKVITEGYQELDNGSAIVVQ